MRSVLCGVTLVVLTFSQVQTAGDAAERSGWVEAMAPVHARFTGEKGTCAHFGDSITVTMAFWAPLSHAVRNAPEDMERALRRVKGHLRPECWQGWKGPQFGNEGGRTARWACDNVAGWLERMNPETALIMFGTNDLGGVSVAQYGRQIRTLVDKCLDNGTVVILSTIPPRHGFVEKAAAYAQEVRDIAREKRVPLVDFHAEILKRRPADWDGAGPEFSAYTGYNVPTLLARDGVHPSHPQKYQNDYSEEALDRCGFSLRNYLVLLKYAEVMEALGWVRGESGPVSVEVPGVLRGFSIDPPVQSWFPKAPRRPEPPDRAVKVSNVGELVGALGEATAGQTILVADGHYLMPHYVEIRANDVALRGASGRRERVVLDGAQSRDGELLGFRACSGVTVSDLTIQNVRWNGFKINSETNVQRLTITNCIIHNIWQRGVKGVKVPPENREIIRPRKCRVQYCLFYNDRPKRLSDDPADIAKGNYIAGVDVMYARDWVISDNVFVGIQGRTHEGRGAIFLWFDARDCIVERNIIIDCDVGLQLGNPHRADGVQDHCVDCMARNNFITRAPEAGIVTTYTKDCKILHNTIHDPESRLGRLIRTVFTNEGLVVANNLLSGPRMSNESDSSIRFVKNHIGEMTSVLKDPGRGNLHLTDAAAGLLDRAVALPEVTEDVDGQPRGVRPYIGADELAPDGASR
ncbi:MAG: right-handed parallel beta-helix repeat-containing protein [Sedimentisphaerales bacterium]|nr:right-handed parallel beta-helix repeat-containing protein [Sedimentisphaerales bacterium]